MKTGKQLLAKAFKFKTTKQKLYGITDLDKKTISINKQYHKSKGNHASSIRKNKDGSANLADTLVHEQLHAQHPKMHEKTVRKLTRKKVGKLSKKYKRKLYNKLNH